MELLLLDPAGQAVVAVRLGPVGAGASEPVHVVLPVGGRRPARRARYSLVGCTVAPGFEFEDFDFLRDDNAAFDRLARLRPDLVTLA